MLEEGARRVVGYASPYVHGLDSRKKNLFSKFRRQEGGLKTDRIADIFKQEVSVAEQIFRSGGIEQHLRLNGLAGFESQAGRNVGVQGPFDDLTTGLLGGQDKVNTSSPGL